MRRLWLAATAIVLLLSTALVSTSALSPSVGAESCQFVLGFKGVHDAIPETVGECLANVHYNPENGDGLQETTNGLMVWRKSDNFTAFTDGYRSWVMGPYGIQQRLNTERFDWEADKVSTQPAATSQPTQKPVSYASVDPRDLEKNPSAYIGVAIMVTGEVFNIKESAGETFLQIWADCSACGYDLIAVDATIKASLPGVYNKTKVTIYGVGAPESSGTNAYGGWISHPFIKADRVVIGAQSDVPPVGLNTKVRYQDFEYSVTEIRRAKAVYSSSRSSTVAKNTYLILFVTNQNIGSGTATFSDLDLVVQDAQGNIYEEDTTAALDAKYQFTKDWSLTDSNPGLVRQIVMCFDIPDGAQGLVLIPDKANSPRISLQ